MAVAQPVTNSTRQSVLVAAIVASSMSYIDSTALTVALPAIKSGLHANDAQAQWVVEGYLVFLSALILIGGALGDRYGRRRLFALGTWIFTLSSIACATSPNPATLILARCIQGIGAALMIPESLALITACYGPGERGRAIGIWASASAVTMAAGPVLGGWLAQIWWGWVFWINVPLAALVLALTYLRVPESRATDVQGAPDVLGSSCVTVGLGLAVYALIEMQSRIHSVVAIWTLVAGIVLLGIFVIVERGASAPVAPPRLFQNRTFSLANLYTLLLYAGLGGALFFVPFELQHVMTYSPFQAGLALLPTILLVAVGSPIVGVRAARMRARLPLGAGALLAACGFALFARLGVGAPYLTTVLPATIVLGIGLAIAVTPLVAAVMGAADAQDVGAASGVNNSISRIGNLVAIAILGIIIAATGHGHALPSLAHPNTEGFVRAMLAAAAMALAAAMIAAFL